MQRINSKNFINGYLQYFTQYGYIYDETIQKRFIVDDYNQLFNYKGRKTITYFPYIVNKNNKYIFRNLFISLGEDENIIKTIFELLTGEDYLAIDLDKIYITVDEKDENTYNKFSELMNKKNNHIIKSDDNINIYYDRGGKYDNDDKNIKLIQNKEENERYINICTIKNKKEQDKNITMTIMNLENILMCLNRLPNIYNLSKYRSIIMQLENISKIPYTGQKEFERIIDNVSILPLLIHGNIDNELIELKIKECTKDAKKLLINKSFVASLLDLSIDHITELYPSIQLNRTNIKDKVIKIEEEFHKTFLEGESIITNYKDNVLDGYTIYNLVKKYSFPIELIKEYNLKMNITDYNRYKNIKTNDKDINLMLPQFINYKEESKFVGYDKLGLETEVIGIIKNNEFVDELKDEGYIFLKENPFYATNGGQTCDSGYIKSEHVKIEVIDVMKAPNGQHLLKCKVLEGILHNNDKVLTHVLKQKREDISKNHTVAHILQSVLSKIIGNNTIQKGARVDENTFRFDFQYEGKLSDELIIKIENMLNEEIHKNYEVTTEIMSIEEAKKRNVLYLDNCDYDNTVRVVTVGDSVSLCGGTHIKNTNEISKVSIISVENKGLNTYRIEGALDEKIMPMLFERIKPYNDEMAKLLNKAKDIVSEAKNKKIILNYNFKIDNSKPTSYKDIIFNKNEYEKIKESVKELEKEYSKLLQEKALSNLDLFRKEKVISKNNISVIVAITEDYDVDIIKLIIDTLLNEINNGFILLANMSNDKVNFICKTNTTNEDIHCGNIIKELSLKCFGNGGGNRNSAQGGGTDTSKIIEYLANIKTNILNK